MIFFVLTTPDFIKIWCRELEIRFASLEFLFSLRTINGWNPTTMSLVSYRMWEARRWQEKLLVSETRSNCTRFSLLPWEWIDWKCNKLFEVHACNKKNYHQLHSAVYQFPLAVSSILVIEFICLFAVSFDNPESIVCYVS